MATKKKTTTSSHYVRELEKQNARLHIQLAKFQVKLLDAENQLKAEKKTKQKFSLNIYGLNQNPSEKEVAAAAKKLGFRLVKD